MRRRVFLFAALATGACASPTRDVTARRLDAGADVGDAGDAAGDAGDAAGDADPTLGKPCVDDAQCDDGIACTFDACDHALARCRNVPDDSLCDDGVYCDGRERCVPAHGCAPGPVVTCEDGDACTIDRCDEPTKACTHAPRDADGDLDEDAHCPPGKDCDDADPTVSSTHAEVCNNHKDDNCNGQVDEQPCVAPQHDTCASPLAVSSPGTYRLSTVGAARDYTASCGVTTPGSAHDVVAAVTIPPGGAEDLDLWATSENGTEVALAVFSQCGQAATELACGAGGGATTRTRARGLSPGTYFVVATTQLEAALDLSVDFLAPTPKATNETCATAAPIALETPFTVELIDAAKDLASACASQTGELTYAFTLAAPADVRVLATTARGAGTPVVTLRDAACAAASDELRCSSDPAIPVYARALPAGSYVLGVSASAPIDASVVVRASAPTVAPADQSCATAPAAPIDAAPAPLSLADHEAAIADGCAPGHPDAALAFTLAQTSDVLVIGRFPQNETGAVSLDAPACTTAAQLACALGATPVRVGKRALAAGDYRVVVADQLAADDSVSVLVRPTAAPIDVGNGANACGAAIDVPPGGGFFLGDTTSLAANFPDSCDAYTTAGNGAPDQVLRLVLAQTQRVVLDMEGSTFATILDVRQGAACPGQEVPGACYVGFNGPRSFLDLTLQPDTYWIVIDGYAGAQGPWDLDVRVLPP